MALRSALATLVVVAAVAVSGCSADAPATVGASTSDFTAMAAGAIEEARSEGATQAQLDAISAAMASGAVSFEAVTTAVAATFECFEATGVRYENQGSHISAGVSYVDYVYEGGLKEAAADTCIKQNSEFVETLYALQPAALEKAASAFDAAMPALILCLKDLGYTVEDDITADELKELIKGTDEEKDTPEGINEAGRRASCVLDNGLNGW